MDDLVSITQTGLTAGFAYTFNICNPIVESIAVGMDLNPVAVLKTAQSELENFIANN